MKGSKTQKFKEICTNQNQTGDSGLVQSKGTKTIYINPIRIIYKSLIYQLYPWLEQVRFDEIIMIPALN